MKQFVLSVVAVFLVLWGSAQVPVDSTGFDGDQLSLPGVLEVFKSSKDLESFAKSLNAEASEVNNLDLNQDGEVDFINLRVDSGENSRAIVLSVDVTASESQDVAIIAMDRKGTDQVAVQIIGDANVYGSQTIVEPIDETVKGGKGGPCEGEYTPAVWCNVYGWQCVNWMFGPAYLAPLWTWSYGIYPPWWARWRCCPRNLYYARCGYWGVFYNSRMVIHCSNGWAAGLRAAQVSPLVAERTNARHLTEKVKNHSATSGQNGSGSGHHNAERPKTKPRANTKPTQPQKPTAGKGGAKPAGPTPAKTKPSGPKPTPKQPTKSSKGAMKPSGGGQRK